MRTKLEEIKKLHPGIVLQNKIDEENMSQHDLAVRTGVTEKHISTIINGTKNISASFAKKLEYALSNDASFWMELQSKYDFALVEFQEDNEITSEEINVLKNLKDVVDYYYFLNWLNANDADFEKVLKLRKLMGVSKLTSIPNISYDAAYRTQTRKNMNLDVYVLYAWQRTCELLTADQKVKDKLNIDKLIDYIPRIKELMFEDINVIDERLTELLAECGIVFKIVRNFVGAPVQGFIKRTDSNRLILCVTLRGKRADTFWFTLFHEIGHIYNGDYENRFVDVRAIGTNQELKADEFAKNALIDEKAYRQFVLNGNYTLPHICRFARNQKVKAFIVIGRLQKEEYLEWNTFDSEIDRYEWVLT